LALATGGAVTRMGHERTGPDTGSSSLSSRSSTPTSTPSRRTRTGSSPAASSSGSAASRSSPSASRQARGPAHGALRDHAPPSTTRCAGSSRPRPASRPRLRSATSTRWPPTVHGREVRAVGRDHRRGVDQIETASTSPPSTNPATQGHLRAASCSPASPGGGVRHLVPLHDAEVSYLYAIPTRSTCDTRCAATASTAPRTATWPTATGSSPEVVRRDEESSPCTSQRLLACAILKASRSNTRWPHPSRAW